MTDYEEGEPVKMPGDGNEEAEPVKMPLVGPEEEEAVQMPIKGAIEAQPFMKIFFVVINEDGDLNTEEAQFCELDRRIGALKDEFAEKFGAHSDRQKWYRGDDLLDDNKTLLYYGIDGQSKGAIIRVMITK